MSTGVVRLRPADAAGVARVTLSHPAKMNALSVAMWQQLREAFLACGAAADRTRVVLVHGEGGLGATQRHEHFGYADSAEHREGLAAFVERRPVRF